MVSDQGPRSIVHVDMDAFYAAVEQRDDPALRGREVIVGGSARRGVVLAASYEVRPKGVRSAMPMAKAVRLAPRAIVVPPRFSAYIDASEAVFRIFSEYTPLLEPLSLDEAFLDVTASRALFGSGGEIARKIRARVRAEVGLPSSAGIAESKFVAKVSSDLAKPDGQKEVPPGTAATFLAPLSVGRLFGVGPKTEERLRKLGLLTMGDLAALEPDRATALGLEYLAELSRGVDDRAVVPDREAKSIGAEDTFEADLWDRDELLAHIHGQALRVTRRLRRAELVARVVVLKLKRSDFRVMTRRVTLTEPTDDGRKVYEAARELLDREWPIERKVRLTGVAVSDLGPLGQLSLLGDDVKGKRLNAVLDSIAQKFGSGALVPADQVIDGTFSGSEADEEARRRMGASRFGHAPEGSPTRTRS